MPWCAKCQAFCVFYSTCKDCKANFCNDCPLTSSPSGNRCAPCHKKNLVRSKVEEEQKARVEKTHQQIKRGLFAAGAIVVLALLVATALHKHPGCEAPKGEGVVLKNGDRNCTFPVAHGLRCLATCGPGYVKVGAAQHMDCQKGKWLGLHACREQSCTVDSMPPLPHIASVGCEVTAVHSGTVCKAQCEGGYLMEGELKCLRGAWIVPTCRKDPRAIEPQRSDDGSSGSTSTSSDSTSSDSTSSDSTSSDSTSSDSTSTSSSGSTSSGSMSSGSMSSVVCPSCPSCPSSRVPKVAPLECSDNDSDLWFIWFVVLVILGAGLHYYRTTSLEKALRAEHAAQLAQLQQESVLRDRKLKIASTFSRAVRSAVKESQQKSMEDLKAESGKSQALQSELAEAVAILEMTQKQLSSELEEKKSREEKEQKSKEDNECVICLSAPKASICMPCAHICICVECMNNRRPERCPLCQADIEEIKQVFR